MFNKSLHDPKGSRTAWQIGQNTDQDYYAWLEEHPVEKEAFHHYMKSHLIGLPIWLDVLDFQKEFGTGASKDDVLFVDVGGSIGQQCEALKKRYPDLPGRVVLQDRPEVLGKALEVEGMETMAYDYLTEQPMKGESPPSSYCLFRLYGLRKSLTCLNRSSCPLFQTNLPQQPRR